MATLSEKIEANARARLTLPPGASPLSEINRYQRFLKVESARLLMLHRSGASGLEVCRARAGMVDALVRQVAAAVLRQRELAGDATPPPLALVALGGYGRSELNPHSDIDLMFLHSGEIRADGAARPALAAFVDTFIPLLWDIGLKPGHSVRSLTDCVHEANSEMQSKTAMIEARLVHGNATLFRLFEDEVTNKCVRGHESEYLAARVADQADRHQRHGNSATMQEPNVKNGCGGLRDYQNLVWMAYFRYRTRGTAELAKQGLLTASDARHLDAAYDFLLRVRNELHHVARRSTDALTKSVQPTIATNLGFSDRSPSRRIERFMGEYYRHSRNIYLITRNSEERLALAPPARRLPDFRALLRGGGRKADQLMDGFMFRQTEIVAAHPGIFAEEPARLMRLFLYAQQRGLKIHPDLARLVRDNIVLIDRRFQRDERIAVTFREILSQRGNVAPTLRLMHELEMLGKYLPEFGRLRCLVQHEFFHRYTADEHTLVCVEKLDRIMNATEPPLANYSGILQAVDRPFVLYLGLLLHDAGKGVVARGGRKPRHTETGARIAQAVARRLHLDDPAAVSLELLVRQHLLMAEISQRRDLDDPETIREFIGTVTTVDDLNMLVLHTLADSLGTSDTLWNGFKDALLRTLHQRARRWLTGHPAATVAAQRQREELRDEVTKLAGGRFNSEELEIHFAGLDPRYFRLHTAQQIIADLDLVRRFFGRATGWTGEQPATGLAPVVDWQDDPDRGLSVVRLCTWDRPGLFSRVAGAFSATGINILGSQGFTRSDRLVLDTFLVADARTGLPVKPESRNKFEQLQGRLLAGEAVDLDALIARQRGKADVRPADSDRLATRIDFADDAAGGRTRIEIETEDRLGLLYSVAQVFSHQGLNIEAAKILTEKGAAIDTFFVTQSPSGALPENRREALQTELSRAIARLDQ